LESWDLKIASLVIGDSIGNAFQTGFAALCPGEVVPLRKEPEAR
jgi:hypothetical protein